MARPTNFGFDRFGGTNTDKPQRRTTPALVRNRANTNKYKLGDYQADRRFKNSGAITPRPGGSNIDWGGAAGMFSNRDPGRFPEGDLAYHEGLRKDVWQKTTPDVKGVGFQTKWRQKADGTWEYTSELGEEEQAIRDAAYTRQEMFLDQASALGAGGWEQAQQSRFDQKRALYAGEDAREAAIR